MDSFARAAEIAGVADAERIVRVARELGRVVPTGTRMYLTGGATAVLEGWRPSTVDVDVRWRSSSGAEVEDELFRFPLVDPPGLRKEVESLGSPP